MQTSKRKCGVEEAIRIRLLPLPDKSDSWKLVRYFEIRNVAIAAPEGAGINSARNLSFRLAGETKRVRALVEPARSMSTPRINGVVETCLYSGDLPRAVRFYQDQLGLRLLESGERLCVFSVADKQVLLVFRSGGTLKPIPTPGGLIPPHDAAGQLHVAFAVSKEDFGTWEKHLIARGITIESKVNWPTGGQSIYFRDPDDHLVELATPGIWGVY